MDIVKEAMVHNRRIFPGYLRDLTNFESAVSDGIPYLDIEVESREAYERYQSILLNNELNIRALKLGLVPDSYNYIDSCGYHCSRYARDFFKVDFTDNSATSDLTDESFMTTYPLEKYLSYYLHLNNAFGRLLDGDQPLSEYENVALQSFYLHKYLSKEREYNRITMGRCVYRLKGYTVDKYSEYMNIASVSIKKLHSQFEDGTPLLPWDILIDFILGRYDVSKFSKLELEFLNEYFMELLFDSKKILEDYVGLRTNELPDIKVKGKELSRSEQFKAAIRAIGLPPDEMSEADTSMRAALDDIRHIGINPVEVLDKYDLPNRFFHYFEDYTGRKLSQLGKGVIARALDMHYQAIEPTEMSPILVEALEVLEQIHAYWELDKLSDFRKIDSRVLKSFIDEHISGFKITVYYKELLTILNAEEGDRFSTPLLPDERYYKEGFRQRIVQEAFIAYREYADKLLFIRDFGINTSRVERICSEVYTDSYTYYDRLRVIRDLYLGFTSVSPEGDEILGVYYRLRDDGEFGSQFPAPPHNHNSESGDDDNPDGLSPYGNISWK